mmetsp:Transcript_3859/g.11422  ORF Transcript_3859/g.11422 Transcript_3859/m.11422 type:complete len:312 (+) Transcript_3859:722-1657(+)
MASCPTGEPTPTGGLLGSAEDVMKRCLCPCSRAHPPRNYPPPNPDRIPASSPPLVRATPRTQLLLRHPPRLHPSLRHHGGAHARCGVPQRGPGALPELPVDLHQLHHLLAGSTLQEPERGLDQRGSAAHDHGHAGALHPQCATGPPHARAARRLGAALRALHIAHPASLLHLPGRDRLRRRLLHPRHGEPQFGHAHALVPRAPREARRGPQASPRQGASRCGQRGAHGGDGALLVQLPRRQGYRPGGVHRPGLRNRAHALPLLRGRAALRLQGCQAPAPQLPARRLRVGGGGARAHAPPPPRAPARPRRGG